MPFLTKADLTPPLYQEIIDEITRGDDAIVTKAINNAIGEMKGSLNRYNLVAMFGTNDTEPTFSEEFLSSLGKDIACWHLIKLANPNINLELFRTAYEDAVKFLDKVMKGDKDPAWPLKPDDPTTPLDEAGSVSASYNKKRNNFY